MILRIKVWRLRRKSKYLSRKGKIHITARFEGIEVGRFSNGREIGSR